MHSFWQLARGPFRCIKCETHNWESYDAHRAGCLKCGEEHRCAESLADSHSCSLETMEDGGLCCTITGYCMPIVRYSCNEYIDYAPRTDSPKMSSETENLADDVERIVKWFLMGEITKACKNEEIDRTLNKCQNSLVKILKQQKLDSASKKQKSLCIFPTVLANAVYLNSPKYSHKPTQHLCSFCSTHIIKCMTNLGLTSAQVKRVNMVVGLLYLMKQGLTIQNVQWLPRVPYLCHCLPHESNLEKGFKLSMKLVCETENEVKLALRQRIKML